MSNKLAELKKDQLQARKDYMKEKTSEAQAKASLLTTLVGEIESTAKGEGVEVTDDRVLATIKKFIKGLDEYLKGDADTVAYLEAAYEKGVLENYLPVQLSEQQLRDIITNEIVPAVGAESMKDMGKVMGALKATYDGQYNGGVASKVVKEVLS